MSERSPRTDLGILPVFTCAGCGGKFTESHTCPSGMSTTSSPGPIFIPIQQWMVKS